MTSQRFFIFLRARNQEMLRDPSTWVWSLIFPLIIVIGIGLSVKDDNTNRFTLGMVQSDAMVDWKVKPNDLWNALPLNKEKYVRVVPYPTRDAALNKLRQHQLDMVLDPSDPTSYWVNPQSNNSQIFERLLFTDATTNPWRRFDVGGTSIRYLDWVIPGVLGLIIMHSCLFGVGFIIVRQRKGGVLKRLSMTPLSSWEFITAHIVSRLLWLFIALPIMYISLNSWFDFYMAGSYLLLLLVFLLSGIVMLSLALFVASRSHSEENVLGWLNLLTWPMVCLSGIWFSLEAAPEWIKTASMLFPLTHTLNAARAIMLDGAGWVDIWPSLGTLLLMALLLITLSAHRFRW